ncbi:DUF5686 and carboxypeptidase regulatory-like domain-containing protein [Hymenobacter sp. BT175]|uniref:DUF5686 and carboxypeptidase regulatory-like domain-containing protein n=1 Tax=Hymenobacter translucens TaxID=2886507 RepID=UPI001D0F0F64|nr:DUF5686 and carboxypeptidase regulatory-like domain-containing protein [Hymenobacter translucens]MCC2546083.1 DUF5686 and carboxypeptidase regulatory-like domain-containing protein [Hymenobacter translucens]
MPRLPLLVCLLLISLTSRAGIVRGRILDPNSQPLQFANVAVRTTTISTASNEQGTYELRLPRGRYELVFQYVGFKARTETVLVAGGDTLLALNVTLQPENYRLGEVVVRGSDRDPAYDIIQQAQQWRRYHQREVASYKTRSYMKSLARLTDVPGKIMGMFKVGPDLKKGIIYLSESVSELSFRQPNVVQERMISSRVSGDARATSFNRAGSTGRINFYSNIIKVGSERGFVSPIAANAMLYYKYELEGSTRQGDLLIHKIRVTPRRRTDPVFTGHVYIVDGQWRLHSVALGLNQDSQLDYVDDIRVEQFFGPAPGAPDVWVLQTQKMTVGFTAFGFKGNGYINTFFSNYTQVRPTFASRPAPTQPVPAPAAGPEPADVPVPVQRPTAAEIRKQKPALRNLRQQMRKAVQRSTRDSLTGEPLERLPRGEVMRVEAGVNEKDSAYWATVRPIPLTDEEQKDYVLKDSTESIRNSKPYQDSLDRVRNKPEMMGFLLTGYFYRNTYRKQSLYVAPVFNILLYSTVEGTIVHPQLTYTKRYEDRRYYEITPSMRYGFANKLLSPSVAVTWQHNRVKVARLSLLGGRTIENFDPNSTITPLINSYYTLFQNLNYAKYYRRDGGQIGYESEIANGLTLAGTVSYFARYELQNTTTKLITDVEGVGFTSNRPASEELPDPSFGRSNALTAELTASYRPGQRYISRPTGKINLGSKYPTFRLTYRQGLGVLGSDVRYTLLEAGVQQSISMGLVGTSTYNVSVGGFPGSPRLAFMDYRHFSGSRTTPTGDFSQFQLLDYYRFSTRSNYLEARYNHHFNGFFLNNIPLLRRLKWQEVGSVNYLHTKQAGHYVELGVGIEHVFKLMRVDFYTALQQGNKLSAGFRYGIGF